MRRTIAAFIITAILVMSTPRAGACPCATTLMVRLGLNSVEVQDVYGLPLHCASGSFSVFQIRRVVQLNWIKNDLVYTVDIRLPSSPINGVFQIYYCWGDHQATVGNEHIPVELTTTSIRAV